MHFSITTIAILPALAVLLLLGFSLKKLISEARVNKEINLKHSMWLMMALVGIWIISCLIIVVTSALGHSQAMKDLAPSRCLLSFSLLVLLPGACLFLLRNVLPARRPGLLPLKGASILVLVAVISIILFLSAKSGMWPPLAFTMRNNFANSTQMLIKMRITLNDRDAYGLAPLEYAVVQGNTTMIKLLLDKGAELHGKENLGTAALWQACMRGRRDAAELLIDRGVDINSIIPYGAYKGWTALMTAAKWGHVDVAKTLVAKGADQNIRNKQGQTALMIAEESGQKEIVRFLQMTTSHESEKDINWHNQRVEQDR